VSLIFSAITPGPNGGTAHGLWLQQALPEPAAAAARRAISSVDPSFDVETWAASPDGRRIAISVRDISRTIARASNVPGIRPLQSK
jgi:hypothetical protein